MKYFIRAKSRELTPQLMGLHTRSAAEHSESDPRVSVLELNEGEAASLKATPAFEVFEDIQFQPVLHEPPRNWWEQLEDTPAPASPPPWATKDLTDVMEHVRAPRAWQTTRGKGVTIAVVDTGVDGSSSEFPESRRSTHSFCKAFSTPWADAVGHGSMCASIACGDGKYTGVAPEATLLAARSTLQASDVYLIYEHLLRRKLSGDFPGGLVVSNSFGQYVCKPPAYPEGHPYVDLLRKCVEQGIVFVFAAGNNHAFGQCHFPASADRPNTIWAVNSIDEVLTVGTVDWNESNQVEGGQHSNSSRGPGQWSKRGDKPDVVAPTYGNVTWGAGYSTMEWWGTSGACPQVAGLAALLLAVKPSLTPAQVASLIRQSARKLKAPGNCVGQGVIDCEAAVKLARSQ